MFQIATFSPPFPHGLIITPLLALLDFSPHALCSVPIIMNGKELHNGIVNSHSQECAVTQLKKNNTHRPSRAKQVA